MARHSLALRAALAMVTSVVSTSTVAQAPAPAPATTITLGQVGLSFYAVVGGVVQEMLEREGYTVLVIQGPHAEIFPRLGTGEVDIFAAAWLPNGHASLYAPVKDSTFLIAPLYEDARFFWVVPAYVPDTLLSSLADLARPAVRERLSPRIVSLPATTGLTISAQRVLDAYRLGDAGYVVAPGSPEAWMSAFEQAVAAREWIVFPLWQPHWLNAAWPLRRLADPKNAYGEPDVAWLLGHRSLQAKLSPGTLATLGRIRLSIDAVTDMDEMVNLEGVTPRVAAARWMAANPAIVTAWTSP